MKLTGQLNYVNQGLNKLLLGGGEHCYPITIISTHPGNYQATTPVWESLIFTCSLCKVIWGPIPCQVLAEDEKLTSKVDIEGGDSTLSSVDSLELEYNS